jgi:hypothetical protein
MPLEQIFRYSGGGLLILLTLVQISPLKINPWSWLGRVIGKALNHDVLQSVTELKESQLKYQKITDKRLDDIEEARRKFMYYQEECEAKDARRRILRASDELRLGIEHSHEYFRDVLSDISFYDNFCREHPQFKNMQAVAAISFVTETYQKCLKENKFL